MDKISKLVIWLSLILTIAAVTALYYKSVVMQDFNVVHEESLTTEIVGE